METKNNFLNQLEKIIGIEFRNKNLLKTALIHRSWLNEHKNQQIESNERLEFLGDAVIELWATEHLFSKYPQLSEGSLTNIRAAVVRTETLAKKAQQLKLGQFMLLSRGEEKSGGRKNLSLLADLFEALVGAIYYDQGITKTKAFLDNLLLFDIKHWGEKGNVKDSKTLLQEIVQAKYKITPYYKVLKQKGPDHNKSFLVAVFFGKKQICFGEGRSKQEAEENTARKALTILEKTSKIGLDLTKEKSK